VTAAAVPQDRKPLGQAPQPCLEAVSTQPVASNAVSVAGLDRPIGQESQEAADTVDLGLDREPMWVPDCQSKAVYAAISDELREYIEHAGHGSAMVARHWLAVALGPSRPHGTEADGPTQAESLLRVTSKSIKRLAWFVALNQAEPRLSLPKSHLTRG
jgi:hypothetical protein